VISRYIIAASWFCTLAVMASSSWCADSGVAPTLVADSSSDSTMQSEVKATFSRFVAGQNTHDPSVISAVILKSRDFVWAQAGGNSIGGSTKPWLRGKVSGTAAGIWSLN
jgi:hypothetical protein